MAAAWAGGKLPPNGKRPWRSPANGSQQVNPKAGCVRLAQTDGGRGCAPPYSNGRRMQVSAVRQKFARHYNAGHLAVAVLRYCSLSGASSRKAGKTEVNERMRGLCVDWGSWGVLESAAEMSYAR